MKISVKIFIMTLISAYLFGVIAGLLTSLWWRSAQVNAMEEHLQAYEATSGTIPE